MNKKAIIKAVRTAINAVSPRDITFRHIGTLRDEERNQACYGFSVNGTLFSTGWADIEYYDFVDSHPGMTALAVQDLKLLLWWLEQGDTKVSK